VKIKNIFRSLTLLLSLVSSSLGQQVQAPGGINFGSGAIVTVSNGSGVPSNPCKNNNVYNQIDAAPSQSTWKCRSGSWEQQGVVLPSEVPNNSSNTSGTAALQRVVARTVLEGLNNAPSILSTTSQPTHMATFSFAVKDRYLFSALGNGSVGGVVGGLNISDITDPAAPVQVGLFTSSSGADATSLSISGNYAYVGYYDTGKLDVWNISNVYAPTVVNTLTLSTPISRSVINGSYLYVGSYRGGSNTANVYIINLATPSAPSLTGTYTTAAGYAAQWIAVNGTVLYVSESSSGIGKIEAVNVATPSVPVLLSAVTLPHSNQAVVLNGNYAYVGSHDSNNMEIINISTPSAMTDSGAFSFANGCAPLGGDVSNNTVFFACDNSPSTIAIVDVTAPTVPVSMTSIATSGTYAESVAVYGRYLYTSHYTTWTQDAIDLGNEYTLNTGRLTVNTLNGGAALPNDITGNAATATNARNVECNGISCPFHNQLNAPFTTTANVTPTADIGPTDTSFTISSFTNPGYPVPGCLVMNSGEFTCYTAISSGGVVSGMVRGLNPNLAQGGTIGPSPCAVGDCNIYGVVTSNASSIDAYPAYVIYNTGEIAFNGGPSPNGSKFFVQSDAQFNVLRASDIYTRGIIESNATEGIDSLAMAFLTSTSTSADVIGSIAGDGVPSAFDLNVVDNGGSLLLTGPDGSTVGLATASGYPSMALADSVGNGANYGATGISLSDAAIGYVSIKNSVINTVDDYGGSFSANTASGSMSFAGQGGGSFTANTVAGSMSFYDQSGGSFTANTASGNMGFYDQDGGSFNAYTVAGSMSFADQDGGSFTANTASGSMSFAGQGGGYFTAYTASGSMSFADQNGGSFTAYTVAGNMGFYDQNGGYFTANTFAGSMSFYDQNGGYFTANTGGDVISFYGDSGNSLTIAVDTGGCSGTPGPATLYGTSNGEAMTIPIDCL